MKKRNEKIVKFANALRKNLTKEERHLWYDFLSSYPIRFIRQMTIGKYIADFYSAKAKLVIEIDGSQHFEEKGLVYDANRTAYLEKYGLRVIRFTNIEVNQHFNEVCEQIDMVVKEQIGEVCYN